MANHPEDTPPTNAPRTPDPTQPAPDPQPELQHARTWNDAPPPAPPRQPPQPTPPGRQYVDPGAGQRQMGQMGQRNADPNGRDVALRVQQAAGQRPVNQLNQQAAPVVRLQPPNAQPHPAPPSREPRDPDMAPQVPILPALPPASNAPAPANAPGVAPVVAQRPATRPGPDRHARQNARANQAPPSQRSHWRQPAVVRRWQERAEDDGGWVASAQSFLDTILVMCIVLIVAIIVSMVYGILTLHRPMMVIVAALSFFAEVGLMAVALFVVGAIIILAVGTEIYYKGKEIMPKRCNDQVRAVQTRGAPRSAHTRSPDSDTPNERPPVGVGRDASVDAGRGSWSKRDDKRAGTLADGQAAFRPRPDGLEKTRTMPREKIPLEAREPVEPDEPQPAVRVAPPTPPAAPALPAPLLQKREVNDADQMPAGKRQGFNPDAYTEEEEKHPHNRGDWLSFGAWTIAVASVRGVDHLQGKYRDDDYAICLLTLPASPDDTQGATKSTTKSTTKSGGRGPARGFFNDFFLGKKSGKQGENQPEPSQRPQQSGRPYAAMIAIADGLGSKQLSRHGARAAVLGVTTLTATDEEKLLDFRRELERVCDLPDFAARFTELIGAGGRELLKDAFQRAAEGVQRQRVQDKLPDVDLLHSTLQIVMAFIHPKDPEQLVLISSQVGDGAVYVKLFAADGLASASADGAPATPSSTDGWNWQQIPQVEAIGTQVTPFMARYEADPERLLQDMRLLAGPVECLLAMTDGVAGILTPYEADLNPFTYARPFWRDVLDSLVKANDQADNGQRKVVFIDEMKDLLQTNAEISDDITLLCIVRDDALRGPTAPQAQAAGESDAQV